MDSARTRQYYRGLSGEDLCPCAYCRNYAKGIKAALPQLSAYLDRLGVDIEKPLEVIPLDESEEYMEYIGAQYVVLGSAEDFAESTVDGIRVFPADSHPVTRIAEDHFVIELQPGKVLRLRRQI